MAEEKKLMADKWYKNHYGWLLFLVINMSGNLCFELLFPYKAIISVLFLYLCFKCVNDRILNVGHVVNLVAWFLVLIIPGAYLIAYSTSATLHIYMKICLGIFTILYCKHCFCKYYVDIICFFAVISLVCFVYNCLGGIVPYINIESTLLDGGRICRVSSILYTQLLNLENGGSLNLRNCGPFWEPGAYQGFLNLALILNLLYNKRDRLSNIRNVVLIVTIITTFSTGGYIALFVIVMFMIYTSRKMPSYVKVFSLFLVIYCAFYLYNTVDFLGEKISTDQGRTAVSLNDLPNGVAFFFGYGYDPASFNTSSIETAAAIINLVRYSGIFGLLLFVFPMLIKLNSISNIVFFIVVILLMMNEPFLTTGPFWWGIPLCLELFKPIRKCHEANIHYSYCS